LTFGLDSATAVTKIEVKWPDGHAETLPGVAADLSVVVEEGKGIVSRTPFSAPRPRPSGSR